MGSIVFGVGEDLSLESFLDMNLRMPELHDLLLNRFVFCLKQTSFAKRLVMQAFWFLNLNNGSN
jgi:hypothetical protein